MYDKFESKRLSRVGRAVIAAGVVGLNACLLAPAHAQETSGQWAVNPERVQRDPEFGERPADQPQARTLNSTARAEPASSSSASSRYQEKLKQRALSTARQARFSGLSSGGASCE